MLTDEELDKKAQEMAEKTLEKLPEAARKAKIGKIKEGILARLKAKNGGSNSLPSTAPAKAPVAASSPSVAPMPAASSQSAAPTPVAAAPKPTTPSEQPATSSNPCSSSTGGAPVAAVAAPAAKTPPVQLSKLSKLQGIQLCGDEPWFADAEVRQALREKVVAAHKEQKIAIAAPADEIKRIWPGGGRILGAGAVLRLGGSHIGGYGETDIGYAYRHLSRALHPDKNPGIPEAPDAFKRLSDAADELRQALAASRKTLEQICALLNVEVEPSMSERPQEALFAEASRLISAVLSLVGEGTVSDPAVLRSLTAFISSSAYNCQPQSLLSKWRRSSDILELLASSSLRTAYDCSSKQYRAQFLCALNRLSIAEAKENENCVRHEWQTVMSQYPELGVWRELREKIRLRVWSLDGSGSSRSKWDNKGQISIWAGDWRDAIRNVFSGKSKDAAVPVTNAELRNISAAMWREIADWARSIGLAQHLELFTADKSDLVEVASQWSFVPEADLLLIVGDGIAGITAEGVLVAQENIHVEDHEKPEGSKGPVEEKNVVVKVSGEDMRRVQLAAQQKLNVNWEQMWRAKNAMNQRRRAPLPTGVRSRSPTSSSSSSRSRRKRRKKRRSRSRGRR